MMIGMMSEAPLLWLLKLYSACNPSTSELWTRPLFSVDSLVSTTSNSPLKWLFEHLLCSSSELVGQHLTQIPSSSVCTISFAKFSALNSSKLCNGSRCGSTLSLVMLNNRACVSACSELGTQHWDRQRDYVTASIKVHSWSELQDVDLRALIWLQTFIQSFSRLSA